MSLQLNWHTLPFANVSQSCLDSPYFSAIPSAQGAYCAFKAPAIQIAQMCCNYVVQAHPQDECTFVCPEVSGRNLHYCLSVVYNSDMATNTYHGINEPSTKHTIQMMCYSSQGSPLPNVTAVHNRQYTDTSSASRRLDATSTAAQGATRTSQAPGPHSPSSGVAKPHHMSGNDSINLLQAPSSASTIRLCWLGVSFWILLLATINS